MTSSGPETPTRTTGTHRAHREARDRGAARTLAQRPPTRYEPYLDGLFTYCLSVLCDHDAATAALADVLVLAERRGRHAPDASGDRRAWLYALVRWACLRKLAEARRERRSTHAAGRADRPRKARTAAAPEVSEEVREQRRRELALLAWPEAAGTTPEQREALELAVRHRLSPREVAAVLGREPAAARELLASAACEVERTRAALAVVETGACPGVARFTGDHQLVLSTALRRELVRHVDDCPRCRRTAERAVPGRWPGTSVTPEALPVLPAPGAALHAAMAHHPRGRAAAPRFDRRGFPVDPKDRVARRDRLRARAVTTTVVATVVAAPVLALWAAYRGTPVGEAQDGRSAAAREDGGPVDLDGAGAGGYENAGNASTRPAPPVRRGRRGGRVRGGRRRHRRRTRGRRRAGRDGRPQRRHHADHPHRDGLRAGPLVRVHGSVLALPEPVVGDARPRRVVDGQGVRRPAPRAVGALERDRGGLARGRGRHPQRPRRRPRSPRRPGHRAPRRPERPSPGSRRAGGTPAVVARAGPGAHHADDPGAHAERSAVLARPGTHARRDRSDRPGGIDASARGRRRPRPVRAVGRGRGQAGSAGCGASRGSREASRSSHSSTRRS
ncbi:hypothetical protein GCM10019016_045960 [Streptomyces prasinosporus]|uniref:Sigma-70 family RNA polymerase sigma factor n=1 Tax=Streptomyces prasinosporus TaxID=68256 RepID=A0ABP6TQB3_9ACTN